MLCYSCYAMKLLYQEDHSMYLPLLHGCLGEFSQLFADYIHARPTVKLNIGPVQLNQRYNLLLGCPAKKE